MPKRHKIKHYHSHSSTFRAKPHPLATVVGVILLVALIVVGISLYRPVYDMIMNTQPQDDTPASSLPAASVGEPSALQPQPVAEPEPPEPPQELRGVYAPHATVSDPLAFAIFLQSLAGTDINAVMVDIKNAQGQVLFESSNPDAQKWGAVVADAFDLQKIAKTLEEHGLALIVREWAFRDETAARGDRKNAIHYIGSEMLWLDNAAQAGGKPWLNPYSRGTQDYISALAVEAAEAGAKLVVLEAVQFPDNSNMGNTDFGPDAASASRQQVLRSFMADITAALREKGVRTSVYFPAVAAVQAQSEMRYGGSPLLIANELALVGALPQQFWNGFSAEGLEIRLPLQDPAATAKTALEYCQKALEQANRTQTALIPLLQGGPEPGTSGMDYTAEQIKAQITAAAELGLREYILYHTVGAYALS